MAHSEKDKITAVSKLRQGVPIFELCSTYNVCVRTIYRWAKEFPETDCKTALPSKQLESLQRRIDKLEKIITVLKAVNCTAHSPHKEKLTELEKLYGQYDVHTLCEALDVPRGTFYNHILRNKKDNA